MIHQNPVMTQCNSMTNEKTNGHSRQTFITHQALHINAL